MQGTMLWFNPAKGHGFIHTEEGERLYVAQSGFLPGHSPEPRCKGREVSFERENGEGNPQAVGVSFVARDEPPRARLRTASTGRRL